MKRWGRALKIIWSCAKERGRSKIILVKKEKNDISIKKVIECMTLDIIE